MSPSSGSSTRQKRRAPAPSSGLSVRARLTLGNVLILGLILGVFAVLVRYGAQVWLATDTDHNLETRAQRIVTRYAQRPPDAATRPLPPSTSSGNSTSSVFPPKALSLEFKNLYSAQEDKPYDSATFALSARGQNVYSTVTIDGKLVRVYSTPVRREEKVIGVAQVAASMEEMRLELSRLTRLLLTLIPVALLAAAAGGWGMTARVLQPVRRITRAAGRIEARDLNARLQVSGGDEFAHLATTFNGMLERLERAFNQQRRFAADASHELRTPLAAVKGNVSLALSGEQRTADEYRQALVAVGEAADRMDRIVEDLLLLARSDGGRLPMDLELLAIDEVMRDTVRIASARAAASSAPVASIQLSVPSDVDLHVVGDAHHLERLFLNLLGNARRHTPADGTITFAACVGQGKVVVTVTDTGEGIPPEHLPHVFESFYRVDSARSRASGGTGLGLAIAKSIVEAHGGTIAIESTPGVGTTVTVSLPQAQLDS